MRRAPSGAARSVRLEVTRGGDVVHGEDYGAAPSVVLSRAEEAFGGGYLVSNLLPARCGGSPGTPSGRYSTGIHHRLNITFID